MHDSDDSDDSLCGNFEINTSSNITSVRTTQVGVMAPLCDASDLCDGSHFHYCRVLKQPTLLLPICSYVLTDYTPFLRTRVFV